MRRSSTISPSFASVLFALVVSFVVSACGDGDGSAAGQATSTTSTEAPVTSPTTTEAPTVTSTTTAPDPLLVLVSNDDGVEAPGIDAVVEMLIDRGDVEVVVVAPDGNRSGSSDTITVDGDVTAVDAATASGYPAVAVSGFPADAVIHALEVMGVEPDLVISGLNEGANIGPFTELSGTVGAARTGARAGYPALAASQGLGEPPDFVAGAAAISDWLDVNIAALRDGPAVFVQNLNIPTCPEGEVRGVLEVPTATDFAGRDPLASDCLSDAADAVDDVDAFNIGYSSLAELTY